MAERGSSGEGQQTGGCCMVFYEPEAAVDDLSGPRKSAYLQQPGRERRSSLCGGTEELAVLR